MNTQGIEGTVAAIGKSTYYDCAAFVERLADGAAAGMPGLEPGELAIFQISMRDLAKSFRAKGDGLLAALSGAMQ